MLWGQQIKVYTDHKKLTRDALGLTSDSVYQWRLLLEEFAPEIIYVKGIHNNNTVADAISRLEHNPNINATNEQNFANFAKFTVDSQCWKRFSTLWCSYNESNPNKHQQETSLNSVFANRSDEDEIYPLTAQRSQMLRKRMQHSSIASSATMSSTKDST